MESFDEALCDDFNSAKAWWALLFEWVRILNKALDEKQFGFGGCRILFCTTKTTVNSAGYF
ncbi:MAG: hypothetical protein H7A33_06735 [Deltaproteobacteria bacterium]|nr:hypothetical protein [Deltaproteobacteria bacterium]